MNRMSLKMVVAGLVSFVVVILGFVVFGLFVARDFTLWAIVGLTAITLLWGAFCQAQNIPFPLKVQERKTGNEKYPDFWLFGLIRIIQIPAQHEWVTMKTYGTINENPRQVQLIVAKWAPVIEKIREQIKDLSKDEKNKDLSVDDRQQATQQKRQADVELEQVLSQRAAELRAVRYENGYLVQTAGWAYIWLPEFVWKTLSSSVLTNMNPIEQDTKPVKVTTAPVSSVETNTSGEVVMEFVPKKGDDGKELRDENGALLLVEVPKEVPRGSVPVYVDLDITRRVVDSALYEARREQDVGVLVERFLSTRTNEATQNIGGSKLYSHMSEEEIVILKGRIAELTNFGDNPDESYDDPRCLSYYGLRTKVGIENILPSDQVLDALNQAVESGHRRDAAADEAIALKQLTEAAGVQPGGWLNPLVVLAHAIVNTIGDRPGAGGRSSK